MSAGRTALLSGLLLLGATGLRAASRIEADPHELYEIARQQLAEGRLPQAAAALAQLHGLISKRPDWDPEGAFANELIPPLLARLKRMEGATRKLDDFAGQALQGLKPPDIKNEISTVKDYTQWATSVIQRLRAERDGVIDAALADPEERALVQRTESYARTEQLLRTDVLERMAEAAGDDILGLLSGDPRLESVLVRFRQLKQELMQSVAEREELERRTKESAERDRTALLALAAVVTDDASVEGGHEGGAAPNVAEHFARFLDGETEALRDRSSLTTAERDLLLANLVRYRRYNQVLVAAGIGADQSGRIEALTQAVADTTIQDGASTSSSLGPAYLAIAGALALCAGFLAWLAYARGRRLASLRRRGGDVRRIAAPPEEAASGRDAA